MTIGKRLNQAFGYILAILVVLFVFNSIALLNQRSVSHKAELVADAASLSARAHNSLLESNLHLTNYLLSGDTREIEQLRLSTDDTQATIDAARRAAPTDTVHDKFDATASLFAAWKRDFAQQLIAKRQQVDAGNATVADLQIFYLNQR